MNTKKRINRMQFNQLAVSYAKAYVNRSFTARAEEFIRANIDAPYYAAATDIDGIKWLAADIVNQFGADYVYEDFIEINNMVPSISM